MIFALTNKETVMRNMEILPSICIIQKHNINCQNGYSVEMLSYFPDFEFNEEGEPSTKSKIPNNPAFIFKMFTPDKPEGEVSFVAIRQTIEPNGDNEYKMSFKSVETKNVSGLTVRKDLTLWVIAIRWNYFYDWSDPRSLLESSQNLDSANKWGSMGSRSYE